MHRRSVERSKILRGSTILAFVRLGTNSGLRCSPALRTLSVTRRAPGYLRDCWSPRARHATLGTDASVHGLQNSRPSRKCATLKRAHSSLPQSVTYVGPATPVLPTYLPTLSVWSLWLETRRATFYDFLQKSASGISEPGMPTRSGSYPSMSLSPCLHALDLSPSPTSHHTAPFPLTAHLAACMSVAKRAFPRRTADSDIKVSAPPPALSSSYHDQPSRAHPINLFNCPSECQKVVREVHTRGLICRS